MKYTIAFLIILLVSFVVYNKLQAGPFVSPPVSFYSLKFIDIDGNERSMLEFKGKNVLLVNVASESGFTSQYEGLQELQDQYENKLVVIGFPCNEFAGQEPGTEDEIKSFCTSKFNIDFLLSSKIDVKGEKQHEVYNWLTLKEKNGYSNSSVKWNFQKYFIDKNGNLINYFYSITKPKSSKITSLIQ